MKKLIAGNWKMNGSEASTVSLIESVGELINQNEDIQGSCEFLVCPAYVHIHAVKRNIDYNHYKLEVGAQDCSNQEDGAYTGDISAQMLKDMGCKYVILGHSERRSYHSEVNLVVQQKLKLALSLGLCPIVCFGEQLEDREAGDAEAVVAEQIELSLPDKVETENLVIAYEPVWAIGTGKVPTSGDVEAMHGFIREKLQEKLADSSKIRILYGGSVKPDNAYELLNLENVNGALIGGASLDPEQFVNIAKAV